MEFFSGFFCQSLTDLLVSTRKKETKNLAQQKLLFMVLYFYCSWQRSKIWQKKIFRCLLKISQVSNDTKKHQKLIVCSHYFICWFVYLRLLFYDPTSIKFHSSEVRDNNSTMSINFSRLDFLSSLVFFSPRMKPSEKVIQDEKARKIPGNHGL